jgi:hypothetical protein
MIKNEEAVLYTLNYVQSDFVVAFFHILYHSRERTNWIYGYLKWFGWFCLRAIEMMQINGNVLVLKFQNIWVTYGNILLVMVIYFRLWQSVKIYGNIVFS